MNPYVLFTAGGILLIIGISARLFFGSMKSGSEAEARMVRSEGDSTRSLDYMQSFRVARAEWDAKDADNKITDSEIFIGVGVLYILLGAGIFLFS